MNDALKKIAHDRRAAVEKFLRENAAVFQTVAAEKEEHELSCTDEECTFGTTPDFEDGWMLLVRSVPMNDSGDENFVKVSSAGLTWSRQLGFVEYIRDALGRGP